MSLTGVTRCGVILTVLSPSGKFPSSFKSQRHLLRPLTRITYFSKLIGISSLAALLQLELFRD